MCCNSVVELPHSSSLFVELISCFTLRKGRVGVYALHKPRSLSDFPEIWLHCLKNELF